MPTWKYTGDEIVQRGEQLYEEKIRAVVEAGHKGEILVINVETGEYVMDADDVTASERAKSRFGDVPLFAMRIGHPALYRLGPRYVDAGS